MSDKKKKFLIAAAALLLAAAIACAVGAGLIKKSQSGKLPFAALPDGTSVSGIEEEYLDLKSASVKTAPDTYIKAAYLIKVAKPGELKAFNLIKTYDAFRLYDASSATGGKILCVYAQGDRAVIVSHSSYKTSDDRAKLITNAIKKLDSNYELLLKRAKADNIKEENILY